MIDAKQECDVATLDISGAFMQADIVHILFEGESLVLLCKLTLKYISCLKVNWLI
jgi:hypothetical protein